MIKIKVFCLVLIFSFLSTLVFSQNNFQSVSLAGTVFANNQTVLSYQTGGCIAKVSSQSLATEKTYQGQILLELDDRNAVLALKTAQARLLDLEASVGESDFAIEVAKAEIGRVEEEFQFGEREFERTKVLFQRGLVNETNFGVSRATKTRSNFFCPAFKRSTKTFGVCESKVFNCSGYWQIRIGGATNRFRSVNYSCAA